MTSQCSYKTRTLCFTQLLIKTNNLSSFFFILPKNRPITLRKRAIVPKVKSLPSVLSQFVFKKNNNLIIQEKVPVKITSRTKEK